MRKRHSIWKGKSMKCRLDEVAHYGFIDAREFLVRPAAFM